jgi:hypothetical protein
MTSCSATGAPVGTRDDGLASTLQNLLLGGWCSGGRLARRAHVEAAGPPARRLVLRWALGTTGSRRGCRTSCSAAGAPVGARDDGLASRLQDLLLGGRSSGGHSGRQARVEPVGPPVRRAVAFTSATGSGDGRAKSGVARGQQQEGQEGCSSGGSKNTTDLGLPCAVKSGGRKVARREARACGGRVSVYMSKG